MNTSGLLGTLKVDDSSWAKNCSVSTHLGRLTYKVESDLSVVVKANMHVQDVAEMLLMEFIFFVSEAFV